MSIREKLPLLVFLFFCISLVFATVALATQDPELEQCKHQCRVQRQYEERQKQECEDKCERYHREKQRREREEEGRRGGGGQDEDVNRDPERERQYRQCKDQCERQRGGPEVQRRCQERCEREYREQEERGRGGGEELENKRDPERERQYRQCKDQCQRQRGDQEAKRRCEEQCEREYRERRREGEPNPHHEGQEDKRDPERERQYRQCKDQCERQRGDQEAQRRCEEQCEREYRERRREGELNPHHEGQEEEEERGGGQQQGKPYVFEDQHFTTKLQTEHGRVQVLQKFTERSKFLFRGIENYRVAIFEADPQTFVIPNHWDAEAVIFVARGRGTISLVCPDKRESFNIKRGDVLRIHAGTTVYMINRSNNEKLCIVKLFQPVSTPGHFEAFFGPGGENPESYYRAFSTELLEAAFNTRSDRLERLFGQQRQGPIIKASEEQIRGLSHHEEGGIWPFGESKGPFNLFDKRASQSNQYGQLYEVDPHECRELRDLDLAVSFANISEGSMIAPFYNSKATKIAIVTNGEGSFEMACPHLSSSEFGRHEGRQHGSGGSRHQGPRYQQVRARLKRGTVYVVPAGHPVITVASDNQNLEILCFDINAKNNEKFLLAGRKNIMNQLERQAKELSFGVPAREVDEVFKNQDEEFFLKGPRQQHEGRAEA